MEEKMLLFSGIAVTAHVSPNGAFFMQHLHPIPLHANRKQSRSFSRD